MNHAQRSKLLVVLYTSAMMLIMAACGVIVFIPRIEAGGNQINVSRCRCEIPPPQAPSLKPPAEIRRAIIICPLCDGEFTEPKNIRPEH